MICIFKLGAPFKCNAVKMGNYPVSKRKYGDYSQDEKEVKESVIELPKK